MWLNREFMMSSKRGPLQFNNKQLQLNDKGLSLVEILVAIGILAIILVPLLNTFVLADKANHKAEKIQTETLVAQNILERLKGKSLEEIANDFNYEGVIDESSPSEEPYVFNVKNISYQGYNFDAKITLDPSPYYEAKDTEEYGDYNKFEMPLIDDINKETNILSLEASETEEAKLQLYYNYFTYVTSQESFEDDDYLTMEKFEEIIINELERKIVINLFKNSTGISLEVDYEYSAPSIEGCGEVSFSLVDDNVESDLEGIYVFYHSTNEDSIRVNTDGFAEDSVIDLYLVNQKENKYSNNNRLRIDSGSSDKVNIYSNGELVGSGSIVNNGLVKKEDKKNRIYEVTVSLYQGGKNFTDEALALELTSTRGNNYER